MDRKTEKTTVQAAGAITADTNSSSMYVGDYAEALVFLDVTAVSGTTPTLLPTVQVSHDDSEWYVHTVGVEIVAAGNYLIRVANIGKYLRVNMDTGGTTPSFTLSVVVQAKN